MTTNDVLKWAHWLGSLRSTLSSGMTTTFEGRDYLLLSRGTAKDIVDTAGRCADDLATLIPNREVVAGEIDDGR